MSLHADTPGAEVQKFEWAIHFKPEHLFVYAPREG